MASVFDTGENSYGAGGAAVEEKSTAASAIGAVSRADTPETRAAARDAAMIKLQGTGQDVDQYSDSYDSALNTGNPVATRAAAANSVLDSDLYSVQQQTQQYIQEVAVSEQDMLDALTASQQMTDRIRQRYNSPVKGEREAVRGAATPTTDGNELDMAAVDRRIQNDLSAFEAETEWTDYAWTFGRELLTLGTATGFDMAGLVGGKNILDAQEVLQGQALAFQAEPDPTRKLALWEDLKRRANEELPQADKVAFLQQMASASGAVDFRQYQDSTLLWSTIDGTTAIGSLVSAPLKSLPGAAKALGNKRLAGRANARALEDVENQVAEKMGMAGRGEAADNAHPVPPPERVVVRDGEVADSRSSLSLETQAELQAHRQQLNDQVNNLITGKSRYLEKGILPEEAARVDEVLQRKSARYIESLRGDVQQAFTTRNPDGSVTITASVVPKGFTGIPDNAELVRAGNKLAELEADGFISRAQSKSFADSAKAKGSSIESIEEGISILQEGGDLSDAVAVLDTQAAQTMTRTVRATISEVTGGYDQDRVPVGSWFLSHRGVARTPDVVADFQAAGRLDNTSAGIARELTQEVSNILKELPRLGGDGVPVGRKKASRRIQQAIVEGDEYVDPEQGVEVGKVWTPDELYERYGLSEKEQAAYYKLRNVYDHLFMIRDNAVARGLQQQGFYDIRIKRPIDFTDEEGNLKQFNWSEELTTLGRAGRAFETAQEARAALQGRAVGQVFDSAQGKFVDVPQDLGTLYAGGGRIVQLKEPISIPSIGRVQHLVVDGLDEVFDIPNKGVLSYKTGYAPRSYDRGVWFVKQTTPVTSVDGSVITEPAVLRTMGMADNEEAALALQRQLTEQAIREGKEGTTYQLFQDRQLDPLELALSGANGGGGRLYTSSRGDNAVPFYKLDGGQLIEEKASRLSAFDALQSNINNIAFHYPRTEWALRSSQRLQNAARRLGVQWNGLENPATGGADHARDFINRQRTALGDWLALPDSWETRWNTTMQRMYEKSLGINIGGHSVDNMVGKIPSKGLWWLKSHDPVTALRGATFDILLGVYNMAQLFVQAQGFVNAASISVGRYGPQQLIRVWRKQSNLRALENAVDDGTSAAMVKVLAQRGILEENEVDYMVELSKIWRKSGLKEGTLTTGDLGSTNAAVGRGLGNPYGTLGNRIFYVWGEQFTRRYSLSAAFDDFVRNNPQAPKRGLTDAEAQTILAKANDYMLNLGRANRAPWQKGLLSIPTQFWQVQAKLLEQYGTFGAGKVLSRKEKLSVALGQLGLYGASGIPVIGGALSYALDDPTSGDADSLVNRTIDEGLWGFIFALAGADVEVAPRGAILADVSGLMYDYLGGDKGLVELYLGAGNSTLGRAGEALQRLSPIAMAAWNGEYPTTKEDYLMALDAVGDIASSWSNASKAYLMYQDDLIRSRSGKALVSQEFNAQTLLMTAMGFAPRPESQTYSLGTLNRMASSYRSDVKKGLQRYMLDMVAAHQATGKAIGEQEARKFRSMVGYLTTGMKPDAAQQMLQEIQEEVMTGKTEFARETQRYIKTSSEMFVDDVLSLFEKSVVGSQAIEEESIQ